MPCCRIANKGLGMALNIITALDERKAGKKERNSHMAMSDLIMLALKPELLLMFLVSLMGFTFHLAKQARTLGVIYDTSFFLSPNVSPLLSPFHFTS